MEKQRADEIIRLLAQKYPNPVPALNYDTPFTLLVAVILSAQCTDKRVNIVTEKLFKRANTPEQFAKMDVKELEGYIFSCGFYRNKASNIIKTSKDILERFGGEVPKTVEELESLSGVGRKTANVVYAVAFMGNAIAVDTHVFRVANRLGLSEGNTPLKVEEGLKKIIDEDKWRDSHHYLIFHGREVCKSQNPRCGECQLKNLCKYWEDRVSEQNS